MTYDLVIKGGRVVSSSGTTRADVGIKGECIAAIGLDLDGREVLDATGKLVLPGAIDVHTHFELPFCGTVSADDFSNGSKAAAMGGVTTFIDFAIQAKPHPIMAAVEARRAQADPKVMVDYGLHAGITDWNEGRVAELPELFEAGVTTYKMFMIYRSEGWQSTDGAMFSALRAMAKLGGHIGVHAENDDLISLFQREAEGKTAPGCYMHALTRPTVTETEAVQRAINLCEAACGRLYIVHLSTGRGADIVAEAQSRGVDVHAETCPQYLLLDDELFKREDGHHFGTCPPIRKPADQENLWKRLADRTLEVLATDTCTFTSQQKAMWKGDYRKIPFGMPGIETMLPLAYSAGVRQGRLSLGRMVEIVCEAPAKLFGLWPRKGTISVGSDADIVLFDPEHKVTLSPKVLATNCDYSPFDGTVVTGWPMTTLLRGKPVMKDRVFVGQPGEGKYIKREPPVAR